VVKVDRLGLLTDVRASYTLLEEQRVDEQHHQSEEVTIEVVASRLDLIRVE